ncbi:MAG: ChaN family lipoprotein [Nitrosomonadales bacterium]|nr:ChaN family lipoprotein [Nitrosomonadales bacterium]
MTIRNFIPLAFSALLAACVVAEQHHGDPAPAAQRPIARSEPRTVNLGDQKSRDELAKQIADKRVIFIGEIHDRLAHHQNQLRIIQSLYERDPNLAIGVEYFQQSFQPYLDDYIAGRIDERDMLKGTEYFKRWKMDYRLIQPIVAYAREKHIPVLALNVSDEIHNKVFRGGLKSLNADEFAQIPKAIHLPSIHYLQRLRAIYNSHPSGSEFGNFIEGVLLWDESMADVTARYLKAHPESRMVVLSGMSHVMYGDGIPERVNLMLGENRSTVMINGNDFGNYSGVADYQLATEVGIELPKAGKLGVLSADDPGGVLISEFTPDSAAQAAGLSVGDRILALNGAKVATLSDMKSMMFDKLPGERMQVVVRRDHATGSGVELQYEVALR